MPYAMRNWWRFLNQIEQDAGARLFWFYGIEYGEKFGRLHIHALTGNTDPIPEMILGERWKAGWARCEVYDPNQGAAGYVAKYMTKDLAEWDISDSAEQARAFYRFRAKDRLVVKQLTRTAQARLAAQDRARRTAGHPAPAIQLHFGETES